MKHKKGKFAGSFQVSLGYYKNGELMTFFRNLEILKIEDFEKIVKQVSKEFKLFKKNTTNLSKQPRGVFVNKDTSKMIVNKTLKRKKVVINA